MNYLLDTHTFLWAIFSPDKISKSIKKILTDPDSVKYVSAITFWEISLKFSLGKIDLTGVLPDQLPNIAKETGLELLNLESDVASSFFKLPKIKNEQVLPVRNKDPFDRLLAWQAISHNYALLTQDKDFIQYKDQNLSVVH